MNETDIAYQELTTLWIDSFSDDPNGDGTLLLDLLTTVTDDELVQMVIDETT